MTGQPNPVEPPDVDPEPRVFDRITDAVFALDEEFQFTYLNTRARNSSKPMPRTYSANGFGRHIQAARRRSSMTRSTTHSRRNSPPNASCITTP